jgi:hypothetical protein
MKEKEKEKCNSQSSGESTCEQRLANTENSVARSLHTLSRQLRLLRQIHNRRHRRFARLHVLRSHYEKKEKRKTLRKISSGRKRSPRCVLYVVVALDLKVPRRSIGCDLRRLYQKASLLHFSVQSQSVVVTALVAENEGFTMGLPLCDGVCLFIV